MPLSDWSHIATVKVVGCGAELIRHNGSSIRSSGVPRGGRGGHGPRAQALEGAPAQRVGANFKRRGEFQPSKSTIYMLWAPRSLCIRGSFFSFSCRRPFFFFFACRFFPQGQMLIFFFWGGGGRRCKHWPPGAGDPRYATDSEEVHCMPIVTGFPGFRVLKIRTCTFDSYMKD